MEFAGCGSILVGDTLEAIFGRSYQGLFLNGFDADEIARRSISVGNDSRFFTRCINDSTKLQVKAVNKSSLENFVYEQEISKNDESNIFELFDTGKMSEAEIYLKLVSIRPYMLDLFEVWSSSAMQSFTLTTVGMAIGHANIRRLCGDFGPLQIWIN